MRGCAVLLVCAALVAGGAAAGSLVFGSESSTNYVILEPEKPLALSSYTLCMRVATELPQTEREIILFAYRTQHYDELNLWRELDGRIGLYMSGDGVQFSVPALGPMQTHLCLTWDSATGATALFVNGQKSLTKIYKRGHRVRSGGKVIIGQDPDDFLGSFEAHQSFVGEISGIDMWGRVLSDTAIKQMAVTGWASLPGDVISSCTGRQQVKGTVAVLNSQSCV